MTHIKKNIREELLNWPRIFIQTVDLAKLLNKTDNACHAVIKRALQANTLLRVRKGLYLISSKLRNIRPNEFELSFFIYEPSIVSLESALSHHGWIPEITYTVTCVTPKRAQEFTTPIGTFNYKHVPAKNFYLGVSRIVGESGSSFISDPWRALADVMYVRHKSWNNLAELESDLRIDVDTAKNSDIQLLKELSKHYPSSRVRKTLYNFLKELKA